MKVASWGGLSNVEHKIEFLNSGELLEQIASKRDTSVLAYGMGRSYGDVCLNPTGYLLNTRKLDHFIQFDARTGVLECEAGVLLKEIHDLVIPQGWMLAVTPGTQLITVGGAIANDVHGKNHHIYGTFGEHIIELTLVRTTGEVLTCNYVQNQDWLRATIGGIGLTGIIIKAKIQLRRISSTFLMVENKVFKGLSAFKQITLESERNWEYTVAWIDCLSGEQVKGIFMRANHLDTLPNLMAQTAKNPFTFPLNLPFSLINTLSLKLFNQLYFFKNKQNNRSIQYFEKFHYPLDSISSWNHLYGKKGFYQYQCVIPKQQEIEPLEEMLRIIQRHQQGSFLVVLKEFSERQPVGLLSFPMGGLTLALDFPNLGQKTLDLLNELDQVVLKAKGRLYLAKDARMSPSFFKDSYPNIESFLKYRDHGISSQMSRRLMGV